MFIRVVRRVNHVAKGVAKMITRIERESASGFKGLKGRAAILSELISMTPARLDCGWLPCCWRAWPPEVLLCQMQACCGALSW